jgi:hypothetical protein
MSDLIKVPLPADELPYKPPEFVPVKTAWYKAVFKGGAEYEAAEDGSWEAIQVPLGELVDFKTGDEKFKNYSVEGRDARIYADNECGLINLARALHMAVETKIDGKTAYDIPADTLEEFVDLVNQQAGAPVKCYIRTGIVRRPDENGVWETVMRQDGEGPLKATKLKSIEPLED